MKRIILLFLLSATIACSSKQTRVVVIEAPENPVPGTVQGVHVEQHRDVVEVPGQLDPTGTYYRDSHKTIYEIRPGRVQPMQYPEEEDTDEPSELRGQ